MAASALAAAGLGITSGSWGHRLGGSLVSICSWLWSSLCRLIDFASYALLVVWALVGLTSSFVTHRGPAPLVCTFLALGHGCSVVLELPDGQTLLYDAGRLGSPTAAARSISGHLWSRGLTRLDAAVISHADVDHYNALPELLRRFTIDTVYMTPTMIADRSAAVGQLRAAIEGASTRLVPLEAGLPLPLGGDCSLRVLHPPPGGIQGSDNANSLVISIEYRGHGILLTGDLESPGLERLLSQPAPPSQILLAPHHGSLRSDPPGFSAWSCPQLVVISGNRTPDAERVAETYRQQGAHVLNTAVVGAVTVKIDQSGLRTKTLRPSSAR